MTFYAIRQISTGYFMSQQVNRTGMRGNTYRELSDKYPPRLFVKKHHAKLALDKWLEGKWGWYRIGDGFNEPSEWVFDAKKVRGRNKDDMEIVTVEVNVVLKDEKLLDK